MHCGHHGYIIPVILEVRGAVKKLWKSVTAALAIELLKARSQRKASRTMGSSF